MLTSLRRNDSGGLSSGDGGVRDAKKKKSFLRGGGGGKSSLSIKKKKKKEGGGEEEVNDEDPTDIKTNTASGMLGIAAPHPSQSFSTKRTNSSSGNNNITRLTQHGKDRKSSSDDLEDDEESDEDLSQVQEIVDIDSDDDDEEEEDEVEATAQDDSDAFFNSLLARHHEQQQLQHQPPPQIDNHVATKSSATGFHKKQQLLHDNNGNIVPPSSPIGDRTVGTLASTSIDTTMSGATTATATRNKVKSPTSRDLSSRPGYSSSMPLSTMKPAPALNVHQLFALSSGVAAAAAAHTDEGETPYNDANNIQDTIADKEEEDDDDSTTSHSILSSKADDYDEYDDDLEGNSNDYKKRTGRYEGSSSSGGGGNYKQDGYSSWTGGQQGKLPPSSIISSSVTNEMQPHRLQTKSSPPRWGSSSNRFSIRRKSLSKKLKRKKLLEEQELRSKNDKNGAGIGEGLGGGGYEKNSTRKKNFSTDYDYGDDMQQKQHDTNVTSTNKKRNNNGGKEEVDDDDDHTAVGISRPDPVATHQNDFILPTTIMVSNLWTSSNKSLVGAATPSLIDDDAAGNAFTQHGRLPRPPPPPKQQKRFSSFNVGNINNDGDSRNESANDSFPNIIKLQKNKFDKSTNRAMMTPTTTASIGRTSSLQQLPRALSSPAFIAEEIYDNENNGFIQSDDASVERVIHYSVSNDLKFSNISTDNDAEDDDAMSLPAYAAQSYSSGNNNKKNYSNVGRYKRNSVLDNSPSSLDDGEQSREWSRNSLKQSQGGDGGGGAGLAKVYILLLEPMKRKFELIQIEVQLARVTIGDILDAIPDNSTVELLGLQKYRGLCRPKDSTGLINRDMPAGKKRRHFVTKREYQSEEDKTDGDNVEEEWEEVGARIVRGEILIAIPEGYTGLDCSRMSHAILHNPKLVKLLQRDDPFAPFSATQGPPGRGRTMDGGNSGQRSRSTESRYRQARTRPAISEYQHVGIRPLIDLDEPEESLIEEDNDKTNNTSAGIARFSDRVDKRTIASREGDDVCEDDDDIWDRRRVAAERFIAKSFASIVDILLPDESSGKRKKASTSQTDDGTMDTTSESFIRISATRSISTAEASPSSAWDGITARLIGGIFVILVMRHLFHNLVLKTKDSGTAFILASSASATSTMGAAHIIVCAGVIKGLMHYQKKMRSGKNKRKVKKSDYGYDGWRASAKL